MKSLKFESSKNFIIIDELSKNLLNDGRFKDKDSAVIAACVLYSFKYTDKEELSEYELNYISKFLYEDYIYYRDHRLN